MAKDRSNYPAFSSEPPEDSNPAQYRLIRTPQNGSLNAIILSDAIIGTWTHYHDGRTQYCHGLHCSSCATGNARRWHGYVALWNPRTGNVSILELPIGPSQLVADRRRSDGPLRGQAIRTYRHPAKPNGRVWVEIAPPKAPLPAMPAAPDIPTILAHMWGASQSNTRMARGGTPVEPRPGNPTHIRHALENGHFSGGTP
jgi:hypothetical protein